MAKLTTRDVDRFYTQLRAEGMSPATVMHHHRVLHAALNQAERWGWINRNPARYATVASSPAPELRVPSPEQAQALVLRAATTLSPDCGFEGVFVHPFRFIPYTGFGVFVHPGDRRA